MKNDAVPDCGSSRDLFRCAMQFPRRRLTVAAVLFDGFSLRQAERFSKALCRVNAPGGAAAEIAAEYELLLLSTQGGIVRSSSGIPVWTQSLAEHETTRLACVVAFRAASSADTPLPRRHVLQRQTTKHDGRATKLSGLSGHAVEGANGACRSMRPADAVGHGTMDAYIAPLGETSTRSHHVRISDRIRASADWLREHYTQRISIAEVATVARMSERNFLRRFKQELGQRPSEFVRRIRLEAAGRLLAHTDLPADKIARRTGIGRGNQLARMFRQHLGLSPTEYRTAVRLSSAYADADPVPHPPRQEPDGTA
ncbi:MULTISPECIES: helix-turn-helix domain-containing protein [Burkholderia]|uniref:helix-turn-helix domain-containing protein n=1 Tax=Burkholderia TaxID=32008 RepID=UPI000B7A9409|nr:MULTISPECIES: AraC family transcriptional regulator [Burkholderia]OXI96963.1 AraC family transcriptional regulator [Burkholderia sp. AU33803]PRD92450.1 AraC family transcriptional regulator [Burkholderia contaminans]